MKTKRVLSIWLCICMLLTTCITATAAFAEPASGLIICQVYGAGGKGDSAADHSFIELYNAGDTAVALEGVTIEYSSAREQTAEKTHLGSTLPVGESEPVIETLKLNNVSLPAHTSYLIRCAAENYEKESPVFTVEESDQEWADRYIDNEQYTITLKKGDTVLDTVSVNENSYGISKQKAIYRNVSGNAFSDGFEVIGYKGKAEDTAFLAHYSPKTMTDDPWTPSVYNESGEGEGGSGEAVTPSYTPVLTTDTVYEGFENDTAALKAQLIGRYNAGAMNEDGGSAEIAAYNSARNCAYIINGVKGTLDLISLEGLGSVNGVADIEGTEIDIRALAEGKATGFTYGDATSVAVSPDGSKAAVALQDADYSKAGYIAVFTCREDGSLEFEKMFIAGVQPDMVTFDETGRILSANEGEPRNGYGEGTADPAGSVTVIPADLSSQTTVGFESFDGRRDELAGNGIVIKQGSAPSVDFEPEYIAVSGNTAYVSLQEANAIAVLDLGTNTFTGIYSAGFEDYSSTPVDIDKGDGAYNPLTYSNLKGIRMPDGICAYEKDGKTYIVTANEGDSREWEEYSNESEDKDIAASRKKVVLFKKSDYDGLENDTNYLFGGRSFTVFEVTSDGLSEVYDSGSDFEAKTAEYLPSYFNCSNDNNEIDDRSGKKGPEPESVTTGVIDGKVYAFIALERIGGIMIYDVTDPSNSKFVNYINCRDFSEAVKDDVSPEGLAFAGTGSSQGILLAANEVSGTVSAIKLTAKKNTYTPSASAPADKYKTERNEAEAELNNYADLSQYSEEGKAAVEKAIADGIAEIKAAEDSGAISAALKSAKESVDMILTANEERIVNGVENTKISVSKVTSGKGYVRIVYKKSSSYKVDYYEVFRSKGDAKHFGTTAFFTTEKGGMTKIYRNTRSLKKGTKYSYRIRGVRVIDGQKYYTGWSRTVTVSAH
ncbi:MAG: choice-of-anchor I family protein [Anaerovoracaceae bacterium]